MLFHHQSTLNSAGLLHLTDRRQHSRQCSRNFQGNLKSTEAFHQNDISPFHIHRMFSNAELRAIHSENSRFTQSFLRQMSRNAFHEPLASSSPDTNATRVSCLSEDAVSRLIVLGGDQVIVTWLKRSVMNVASPASPAMMSS